MISVRSPVPDPKYGPTMLNVDSGSYDFESSMDMKFAASVLGGSWCFLTTYKRSESLTH